jgi:pimeloyl-ACP methyl ester carboxylesterase
VATVICLHSSAGSGRQWASLAAAFGLDRSVLAPDLIGYGRDESWLPDGGVTLDAEAARIEAIVDATPGPVCLVGHSYGAAVATRVALRRRARIAALALHEPVLFSLVAGGADDDGPGREIVGVGTAVRDDVGAARVERAAERFVDYWSGDGAWDAMDERRRRGVCARMPKVACEFGALFGDAVPLHAYARLTMPVLLLEGEATRSPPKAVARRLRSALPNVRRVRVPGAGHMAPVTHPGLVNAEILRFVRAVDRRRRLERAA